ncbi:poly(A) RNA polymerase, mitochondrial [Diorhabda sublineata]|uniref:poly(A) RNA polymerase, mitochondrial n=1 Tax=Diorhabda sublineata TaxID=1163346 RepID=UPI0024E0786C|nr:poly(A) RNA polymerase, mitochondrial [Diorhabda sublineata]
MSCFINSNRFKYLDIPVIKKSLFYFQTKKTTRYKPLRNFCTHDKLDEKDSFIPFLQRINLKRSEAKRSIVVQVQSPQSFKELWSFCNSIGNVKCMLHYSIGIEPMHFIIVEFDKETDIENIMKSGIYANRSVGMPTKSHFLWFKAPNKKSSILKEIKKSIHLSTEFGTRIKDEEEIRMTLIKSVNISDQIKTLYDITKLNDIGTRLRYLTALQIEDSLRGMFPHAIAYPFGSSVNGYGKMGCDLDLFLRLADDKIDENGRLVFHCKPLNGSDRSTTQRCMETIGDIIHNFLPGCGQVRRILQARVPIIKYHQQLTDVECDISMSNMSGVHMSDFLYIMGELDERVRPLIFAIRKWAKAKGITNSSPGRWISNFALTLLVIAFLQNPSYGRQPILPSLNKLTELAGANDRFLLEDGTDVSFLRDVRKYKQQNENRDSLEQLVRQFYEHYAQFDFEKKAVCLNETVDVSKPEFSPIYIINPLERGLNVSKNVSTEEVIRFQREVRNAAWILESQESKSDDWGLLSLLYDNSSKIVNRTKPGRLVEVRSLFDKEAEMERRGRSKVINKRR